MIEQIDRLNFNLHPVVNFKEEPVDYLPGLVYDASSEVTGVNNGELILQAGRVVKYNGDIWYCTDLDNDGNYTWYSVTIRKNSDEMYCYKKFDKTLMKFVDVSILGKITISNVTGLQDKLDTIPTKTSDLTNDSGFLTKQVQSDWDQTDNTEDDYIKNKPTIPTVGDGELKINASDGSNIVSFKANQNTDHAEVTLSKTHVGLNNVDNTSDTDKPVSTAQQTAIDNAKSSAVDDSKITLEKTSDLVYTLKQNGNEIGTINIPKDLMVSSGKLSDDGTQLILVLNDEAKTEITIDVSKLIDVYSGSTGTTVNVTVNADHSITAELVTGSIGESHLTEDLQTKINGKVDKEDGKGLSTNDYTTDEKTKLSNIEAEAQKNVQSDWNQTDNTKDDFIKNKPTNVSEFTNNAGYVTSQDIEGKLDKSVFDSHTHNGSNSERVDYNDLLNLPAISEAARYVSGQLTGGSGDIAMATHGCGYSPVVYCVKGKEVIEIYFEINYSTGNVHWEADPAFTASDDVHIIMVGALGKSSVIDSAKKEQYWCGYEITKSEPDPRKRVKRIAGEGMMDFYFRDGGGILRGTHFNYIALTEDGVETPIDWDNYDDYKYGQYGDIFVAEKQQLYFRAEETDEKYIKKLSLYPLDGFQPYYPEHLVYIGKYEATADNDRQKLYSRVIPDNELADYIGGDKNSSYLEKLKGMPVTNLNTDAFRAAAKRKGSHYGIQDFNSNNMLFDMFIAEYGTTNCQEAVQSDDPVTGYRRGGLGNGLTNSTTDYWNNYNGRRPMCKCGVTDSLKNGSGEVKVETDMLPANKLFANCLYGIENIFGHLWHLVDGLHIFQNKTEYVKAYFCNNPDKYRGATSTIAATDENNQAGIGYEYVGNPPLFTDYPKYVIWGDKGLLLAKDGEKGSATTYFPDRYYNNTGDYSLRCVALGGDAGYGAYAGFGYVSAGNAFSYANRLCGSRLCYYKKIK